MIAQDMMTTTFVTINAFDDALILSKLFLEKNTDAVPIGDYYGNVIGFNITGNAATVVWIYWNKGWINFGKGVTPCRHFFSF